MRRRAARRAGPGARAGDPAALPADTAAPGRPARRGLRKLKAARPPRHPGPLRLALTAGDPAGIGPEVVLKALVAPDRPDVKLTVYGAQSALDDRARRFGLKLPAELGVEVVDVPTVGTVSLGHTSAVAGRAAAEAVLRAVSDIQMGRADALVTAPLNKESLAAAGYRWPGHTEMLAEAAGVAEVAMVFVGGGLRVALLTIHTALRSVPDALDRGLVLKTVRLLQRELPALGLPAGRLALCALNPHAGEGGLFGREELEVLNPAAEELRAEGVDISGPLPADTAFVRAARGEFDLVVAAYHDQGLIPVKLAAFGRAVNVTIGLPFVRTSVDHGTGFDIAERGVADAGSLVAAIELAAELAARRIQRPAG